MIEAINTATKIMLVTFRENIVSISKRLPIFTV